MSIRAFRIGLFKFPHSYKHCHQSRQCWDGIEDCFQYQLLSSMKMFCAKWRRHGNAFQRVVMLCFSNISQISFHKNSPMTWYINIQLMREYSKKRLFNWFSSACNGYSKLLFTRSAISIIDTNVHPNTDENKSHITNFAYPMLQQLHREFLIFDRVLLTHITYRVHIDFCAWDYKKDMN